MTTITDSLERIRQAVNKLKRDTDALARYTGSPRDRELAAQAMRTAMDLANLAAYVAKQVDDHAASVERSLLS
jgi:hypothetical protein